MSVCRLVGWLNNVDPINFWCRFGQRDGSSNISFNIFINAQAIMNGKWEKSGVFSQLVPIGECNLMWILMKIWI